jgi:hypothetical protein
MGLYDTFETDANLETEGVFLDYGDFRVRVAHTGGANKKYIALIETKLKPLRRAMEAGSISNDRAGAIMMEIFAKTIILDWQTRVGEDWEQGIEDRDGNILPFNEENVMVTLRALPKLFQDIQEQANSIANFRAVELETEAKNS